LISAAALMCLTQAIYFEARGEPVLGQYAVAEVVMNRVDSPDFPDDVCAVVAHDLGPEPWDCQFSYMCDGVPETMYEVEAAWLAGRIAYVVASGVTDLTKGALYFHAQGVSPRWSRRFEETYTVGRHVFYRP